MSDYVVPEEILIEILLKLPVKSLIRGTSVCKQWRSLIRSPYFIYTHLSNTQNQALFRRYDNKESREYYTVIPKRGRLVINSDSEIEFPFKGSIWYIRVVGSCDGLVCLFDDYNPNSLPIIIWNPAIRSHMVLPQPLLVNPYNESNTVVLGFGVASNVYKVVRLFYRRKSNGDGFIVQPQAEIFCLGTGRWRKLTGFDDVRGIVPQYPCRPIFFEGFVHWIASDPIGGENSERNSILRFHVGDEVFGEIMLPQELERVTVGMRVSVSLSMMGERLGAFKIDGQVGNERCDVWMMKDYGVKESWTKLYTIDSTVRFLRVIGFRGSDEALLNVHGCELASYNPETKGIRHVAINRTMWSYYVDDYKESLVLLGGGYSGDSGE